MLATFQTIAACSICGNDFPQRNSMTRVCSLKCSTKVGSRKRQEAKADRKATKAKLEALEPLSKFEKRAEKEVNRYVRLRDHAQGCISCHLPAGWDGQWHASHFRSVGAASAVRFNLWNIHKGCVSCNRWKGGNIAEYEPQLALRIGQEKIDWLKAQNQVVRYSRDYLERLRAVFAKRNRRLEKRVNAAL